MNTTWWINTHGPLTFAYADGNGNPIDATGPVNVTVVDMRTGLAIVDGTTWPVDISANKAATGTYRFNYRPTAAGVIEAQAKATAGGVPVPWPIKATVHDIWDAVPSHPSTYGGNTIRLKFKFTADVDLSTTIPIAIYSRDTRQAVVSVADISGFRQSPGVYFYDWQAPAMGQYAAQALGTVGGLVQGVPIGVYVRDPLSAPNTNP